MIKEENQAQSDSRLSLGQCGRQLIIEARDSGVLSRWEPAQRHPSAGSVLREERRVAQVRRMVGQELMIGGGLSQKLNGPPREALELMGLEGLRQPGPHVDIASPAEGE